MLRLTLTAASAALLLGTASAGAVPIRFDFSGTTQAENFTLPRGQAYEATAIFEGDTAKSGETVFGDSVFDGALTAFEVTIGGETLTANRPGRALQDGTGGADGSSTFAFDLGAGSPFEPDIDAIDGTIAGTDGTVYDPERLSLTLLLSFAAEEFLFDDVDDLLNAVEAEGSVTLPSNVGVSSALSFAGGGNIDFAIEGGVFSVVDGGGNGGGGTPVIPLPAGGWLLLGGLAGLAALRRR